MHELPEPVQFCLRTTERIAACELEALSSIERVIFRAYTFDMEEQNGGLSQFFYNTDASPDIAEETALALETIGAPKTAAVFRAAASVVCRPEHKDYVGTWGGYLSQVDPDRRLRSYESEVVHTDETVDDLLECYILDHRHELETSDA